ncbi:hypothetical protein BAUCODRAFT_39656 [Baudoinia panamericana UAMH 10762]|uniref:Uncharacterized protein n=1 Tax=Baudoinia panamericana (strain UAMH 10762) TaxID=717646 RepID=M2MJK2_BAUPA|nr:uncharacterized protein BAUCODRAFT_39656 [Baudoinia panamericana UAMH 10762]EMC91473.1 hypothetical protein BAUCODRAFT_39656 [Baudoinia panamericana UAMH 10762]
MNAVRIRRAEGSSFASCAFAQQHETSQPQHTNDPPETRASKRPHSKPRSPSHLLHVHSSSKYACIGIIMALSSDILANL